ncbi:hypothetical protein WN944_015280 [Citrus x changshan-huyou]|uniref:Uncharacterized protein n=1 Tax=Citrus x changshan-huyou TaxID=2935761 RepID=A0AAP0MDQ5_9ROSI
MSGTDTFQAQLQDFNVNPDIIPAGQTDAKTQAKCDNCRRVYSVDVIAPGRALRMEDSVNGKGSSHNVSIDLESAQFCVQVK